MRTLIVLLAVAVCAACAPRAGAQDALHDPALRLPATPRSLASPAGSGSGTPSLAVSPEGVVWLSWFEPRRAGGHALRAARLAGRQWAKPITIAVGDSFFVNWADFPTLLPLGPEYMVAHWPWKSGADTYAYDVRVAETLDGGRTWSMPVTPHGDGTATEHGFVSMVPQGDGARLVWLDGRDFAKAKDAKAGGDAGHGAGHGEHGGGDMALRTAWLAQGGRVAEEQALDARVCDCCQTAAVATAGGVVVAYRDRDSAEVRDISAVRFDGTRWSEPYAVSREGWTIEGCPVNGPALDADGDRVVAAWYTAARDTERVLAAFSTDGGRTFGDPMRVDEGAPHGRVDVVALADGSAIVTWLEASGAEANVMARRVRGGTKGEAVTWARTSGARGSGFPRLVRAGELLVLAWTEAAKPSRVRTALVSAPGR